MFKKKQIDIKFYHIIILFLFYIITHYIVWYIASSFQYENFISIFTHTDASRYARISSHYYSSEFIDKKINDSFAFFPFWPMVIHFLGYFIKDPNDTTYCLLGSGSSLILFMAFIFFVYKSKYQSEMKPQTLFGWFFLFFSPASYIFHTNHTESLFLLLSWIAFNFSIKGKNKTSSLIAGICSLIKNQGVITSLIIACINFTASKDKKISTFIYSGLISFSIFILWPIYQYIKVGDPLAFSHVQVNWQHAHGVLDYLWTWLYNIRYVIQLVNGTRSLRAILFYIGIIISIYLIFYKKTYLNVNNKKINISIFFGLYILICSAVLPMQGYLENTFRFHLIIFSLWFLIGDLINNFIYNIRSKLLFSLTFFLIITALLSLNLWITYLYGLNKWAY